MNSRGDDLPGDLIRRRRLRKGWSQDRLAEEIGAEGRRWTVMVWEKHEGFPGEKLAVGLARVLGGNACDYMRTAPSVTRLGSRLAQAEAALDRLHARQDRMEGLISQLLPPQAAPQAEQADPQPG